jgi:hypothetical protein
MTAADLTIMGTRRDEPSVIDDASMRQLVAAVGERIAAELASAIERDAGTPGARRRRSLHDDRRGQQVLVGRCLGDEITRINQLRLTAGLGSLSASDDAELRRAVVADLTGAGPLQALMG